MAWFRLLPLAGIPFLLSACAPAAIGVMPQQFSALMPGAASLGAAVDQPSVPASTSAPLVHAALWKQSGAQALPAAVMPVLGALAGGAHTASAAGLAPEASAPGAACRLRNMMPFTGGSVVDGLMSARGCH
jgi:hypothetical protein